MAAFPAITLCTIYFLAGKNPGWDNEMALPSIFGKFAHYDISVCNFILG
jgi:hypothetical protein